MERLKEVREPKETAWRISGIPEYVVLQSIPTIDVVLFD